MIASKEYRLKFDEKARYLVSQMTLAEKAEMMSGHCKLTDSMGAGNYNKIPYGFSGCERLGIPTLYFCDGPRGVLPGNSTCFPVSMASGATFDRDLLYRVGRAIGKEVLACGGNFFGGVCMNIPYNPGAGRSQECFGEDSYHMGEMGTAIMQGVQDEDVIACVKHFALNSMESARFSVSIDADKRTEEEVFFPHFKKVIHAGAASLMSAYNKYQGEYCGHNKYLLRDQLKGSWDFDGFVISDFAFGVRSASGGISGGCDVEMHIKRCYTLTKVKKALKKGTITQEMIDDACVRIARTALAFDAARKESGVHYDAGVIACPEHIALAKEVADKAITLLKNESQILPLSTGGRIVIAGDLADIENIGDHGSSRVRPPYVKTLVQAIRENYSDVDCTYIPTKAVPNKLDVINRADAVVIVCGMSHGDEGEYLFTAGGDRTSLELKKTDLDMISRITDVNKNSIVVLMGGNVIMTHSWKDTVRAILFAYYPGMEGGSALADILFGKVNPSGKLPFAIAESEEQYPSVNWRAKNQHYGYYHGYQKIDKDGGNYDYPYGYGLSYTSFELSNEKLVSSDENAAVVEVNVKNTGSRRGAEVVQVYVSFPESVVDRPIKALKGFAKVELEPGEQKMVQVKINKNELGWYDENKGEFVQDSSYIAFIGTDEQTLGTGILFS